MAARLEPYPAPGPAPKVVELRHLRGEDLDTLLEEETAAWRAGLEWDFAPSADLVRRFVRIQALNGHALVSGNSVIGYSYFVCEERKGLIGDLYVLNQHANIENENRLLDAVLRGMRQTPFIHRVESQLMMLRSPLDRSFPMPGDLRVHAREFMMIDLERVSHLHRTSGFDYADYGMFDERRQEEAAHLIALSYEDHVDSSINDQYRSTGGARKFLLNIVQYPGCGSFHQPGSFIASDPATGKLWGISLASMVANDVGHITQICVHPEARGKQIGYELLRHSLRSLREHGCRKASLTVTSDNTGAIKLYEDVGFVKRRRFAACVWDW